MSIPIARHENEIHYYGEILLTNVLVSPSVLAHIYTGVYDAESGWECALAQLAVGHDPDANISRYSGEFCAAKIDSSYLSTVEPNIRFFYTGEFRGTRGRAEWMVGRAGKIVCRTSDGPRWILKSEPVDPEDDLLFSDLINLMREMPTEQTLHPFHAPQPQPILQCGTTMIYKGRMGDEICTIVSADQSQHFWMVSFPNEPGIVSIDRKYLRLAPPQ